MRRGVMGGLLALGLVCMVEPVTAQSAREALRTLAQSRAREGAAARNERAATTSTPLIRPNQFLSGDLAESDARLQNGWVVDQWVYQGARNELAAFTVKAAYEANVAIFLQKGTELTYLGEGKAATGQATLELKLPADGMYTLFVVGTKPTSRGGYTLAAKSQGSVTAVDYAKLYPGGGDPNGRYALLVAADDYPGEEADLVGGPTNDALLMRGLLVDRYGFRPENILILRDVEANRDQIVEAFRRHLGQAGPNGVAVFHYSGHGMQLPDNRGLTGADDPEPDNKDEAVATWGTQGDLYGYLLDDELGILTGELRAGRALIVLDMCHAGTGTRGGPVKAHTWQEVTGKPEPKFTRRFHTTALPAMPEVRFLRFRDIASQVETPAAYVKSTATGSAGNEYNQPANHVLLAASQPTETSANYSIQLEGGKTARVGLFTFLLFRALSESSADLTFTQLLTQMAPEANRLALEFKESSQVPQVEGSRAGESIAKFLGSPR